MDSPETQSAPDSSPDERAARLDSLERDVRDLHLALQRNITAIDTLAAEVRELRGWIQTTSASTKEIAESRIWRALTWMGGIFLSLGPKAPPPAAALPPARPEYEQWMADFEANEVPPDPSRFAFRPEISVVPAAGAEGLPEQTAASIRAQSYPAREICQPGQAPGGDYVALVEPGIVLACDALLYAAGALQGEPRADFVYADEDSIDASGVRRDPFFKPEWSPDLLLSLNYIGGFAVFRRQLAEAADLLPPRIPMYDMVLRLCARAAVTRRVPRVLSHRSPAAARDGEAERRAIDSHLCQMCPGASTEADPASGRWRVRYPAPAGGAVSIIIPSGGKADLLAANLRELAARTEYRPYEVLVVDNSSADAIERLVKEWSGGPAVRYLSWRNKPFNFAAICNAGAARCASPLLLFLNDDVTVLQPGWLGAMVELAARPEVGAVGARLLFPDGRIQHAGIVLGLFGSTGHVFKGLDGRIPHYFGLDRAIRNVSAVTGACLMVRAEVFRNARGFDEDHYPVDFNDVDLCLRLGALGYRVLYTPYAELCHAESVSKRHVHRIPSPAEAERFRRTWSNAIANDPFYNPNLTRDDRDCSPRQRR